MSSDPDYARIKAAKEAAKNQEHHPDCWGGEDSHPDCKVCAALDGWPLED